MSIEEYLAALDAKLREIAGLVSASTMQREMDSNAKIGFVHGSVTFVDGSRFEFAEQLPTERKKFRLNYMDAANRLIARWDSAPHHKKLCTFPFHQHTPKGVAAHKATTTLEVLDEITKMVKV